MKTTVAMFAMLALAAGPAAAQGYGTFSPNGHPPPGQRKPPSMASVYSGLTPQTPPSASHPSQTQKIYGPPDPPQPKTYSPPKPPKSCEGSVFVDACHPGH